VQRSGSVKARGAFHFLLTQHPMRVVTAAGGNHGLAVAVAACALGVEAMPTAAGRWRQMHHPDAGVCWTGLAWACTPSYGPSPAEVGVVEIRLD
jgi:Pyridoxal-phosphate dependent enzyme